MPRDRIGQSPSEAGGETEEERNQRIKVELVYLLFAVGNAVSFGIEKWRYRSVPNYYFNGTLGLKEGSITNFWELANSVFLTGAFFVWVLAALSTFLTFFQEDSTLNKLIWKWGVFGILSFLNGLYFSMTFMSYDRAYRTIRQERYSLSSR
mmetsp:Transcript_43336/g.57368  ORF Transcript_43336/g.57368 Transcript_43336/m.57368 type:complete len:151 (+) Transcript_43336:96-548(+)|eukprot:CAMPEP_0170467498 /NCGR_PEP_ID=MMETSP0123-20130129/11054_1 /TAXON_ID=182087 /ORGANISM="Favella ehrenbergii, Strain Fehren 1" /LENGTH=150 /DNA_ID=CAMNT_0010733879 /DNA_START=96 /DNA_END=548 /DNA_ORIENTATION=+